MKNFITKKVMWTRIATFSAIILGCAFLTNNTFAITYSGIGGRPAFPRAENPRSESIYVHTLEPLSIQKEGVLVVNNTNERKTILVYGVDSTPSTGGSFACKQIAEANTDVGSWMKFDQTEVTLEPGTNTLVPFSISVPNTASVGEHNGCVITQEKKDEATGGGAHLSFRSGLRVAVTVPGTLERNLQIVGLTLVPREDGTFLIQSKVKNTGNVSIDANVKVITKHIFGNILAIDGGQYPILRNTESDLNFELKKPFWGGFYRSTLVVQYDKNAQAGVGVQSGQALTKIELPTVWFFSFPTTMALIIELSILIAIALAGILFWLSRKQKKARA